MTYVSVDAINVNKTKNSYRDDGVVLWTNEATNVVLTSEGDVLNENLKKIKPTDSGCYCVKITDGISTGVASISFNTLFSRMVLGEKLGTRTIMLKDKTKGYVEGNIEFVNSAKVKRFRTETKEVTKADELLKQHDTGDTMYTVKVGDTKYITEDFAEFPTRELAEWHQDKVTKGKSNAQIVLDYNGGYTLAYEIYRQEVQYNAEKPFENFVDVMRNDTGITTKSEQYAIFERVYDNVSFGLVPKELVAYVSGRKLTLDEAKTINDKVVEMHKLKRSVALLEGDLKALVK